MAKLTEGPIRETLIRLTIPMLGGVLGVVAFNLIDTYFVGQLGTEQLAAMSLTFPVILIIGSVSMGLGISSSALISTAIGEGDHHRIQKLTTHALALSVVVVALAAAAGLATIGPVFRLLGADDALLALISEYMSIWYVGIVFLIVPMVGNNAIRATGDTTIPTAIMLVAVVMNGILDPLLIFGLGPFPAMGLAGAALATVTARALTLVLSLYVLLRREKMISLSRKVLGGPRSFLSTWKSLLRIALPAAGANVMIPVSAGVVTALVAAHGSQAVAGLGVATRIEAFSLMFFMALSSVLGPFVGQNRGARLYSRVRRGVKEGHMLAFGWGLATSALLAFLGPRIAPLFNSDPVIVRTVSLYLWIVPISYGFLGVSTLSVMTLNVLRRPYDAAGAIMFRALILHVPLALAGSAVFGVPGIFAATALANTGAGLGALIWVRRVMRADEAGVRPAVIRDLVTTN